MSSPVTSKAQNFFKAVTSETDRQDLIKSLVQIQSLLQLKQEGVKVQGPQDLTIIKASKVFTDGLAGKYVTGPPLSSCEVTIAFELAKAMFFCTGKIGQVNDGDYALYFKKIFELQRRDAYRVNIAPDLISARLAISKVGGKLLDQDFRISDLSTGGLGLATTEELAAVLPVSEIISGLVKIGAHQAIEITAKIKYHRNLGNLGNMGSVGVAGTSGSSQVPTVHIGCEFQSMTSALNQKIGFLVNDCHRIVFSRISK